jgi:hypothetical protein
MVPGSLYPTHFGDAMSRLATVLRRALRIIADGLRFVGGLRFVYSLSGHGGLAGENELRDVGKSDGVTACDALASELPDEIAEDEIDLIGGGETVDVGEKLGGENLGIDGWNGRLETVGRSTCGGSALHAEFPGIRHPLE